MKNSFEKFSQFEIASPKYIFGGDGDDGGGTDKTKAKVRGQGAEGNTEGN